MKVCDVCKTVDKSGLAKKQNAEIAATLDRMAKGKFSFTEKFEMGVAGVKGGDMQALAQGAEQIVVNDFKGDAKAALGFLNDMRNTGISQLDFSQIVSSGAAHRLVQLQKTDPGRFQKVCAGHYNDVAALNQSLGGPAAEGPVQAQAVARNAQTRPAVRSLS